MSRAASGGGGRAASAGRRRLLAPVVLLFAVLLLGCDLPTRPPQSGMPATPAPGRDAFPRPSASAPVGELPRLAASPSASPASSDALVHAAVADVARRAGTAPEAVTVVLVEPREWPDRSLGCPEPGLGYAQSITPGFLIVVESGGRRFRYHADHTRVRACDSGS